MSDYQPGRVYGSEAGYALTEDGPLLDCSACGQRVKLEDRFSTDGVTTLHWKPKCDPDWKPDPRPSLLKRFWRRFRHAAA